MSLNPMGLQRCSLNPIGLQCWSLSTMVLQCLFIFFALVFTGTVHGQSEGKFEVHINPKLKLEFLGGVSKTTFGYSGKKYTIPATVIPPLEVDSSTWYKVSASVPSDNVTDNIYHNGFVGIGTTTPTNLLNVQNTAIANPNIAFFKSLNGSGGYAVRGESVNAGGALGIYGDLAVYDGIRWNGVRGNSGVISAPAVTGYNSVINGVSAYFNERVGIGTATPTSTLSVNGSQEGIVTVITATTTLNATHHKIVANNGATNITITLPNALTCIGREYIISRYAGSTGTITVVGTSSQIQALAGTVGATTTISGHGVSGQGLNIRFTAVNIGGVGVWVRL